jgi:hypothetical protein
MIACSCRLFYFLAPCARGLKQAHTAPLHSSDNSVCLNNHFICFDLSWGGPMAQNVERVLHLHRYRMVAALT